MSFDWDLFLRELQNGLWVAGAIAVASAVVFFVWFCIWGPKR